MPEGPEIRRAADQIERAIAHHPLTDVFFAFERLKPYEVVLRGDRPLAVKTRGKAMLIGFENRLTIYSHNQLYGKWFVRQAQTYPHTQRQLRLALHTAHHSALLYSASDIEVLTEAEVLSHPFLSRLGPDVLDSDTSCDDVMARLLDRRFHRRGLASLLLDQGFLCGLGNYLRSEVLFVAGVHPTKRPIDCTPERLRALADGAIALSRQSYQTGGITNDLHRAHHLKQMGYQRSDYRHFVFGRDGKACFVCATPIVKANLGGRRCYYCPTCQPLN